MTAVAIIVAVVIVGGVIAVVAASRRRESSTVGVLDRRAAKADRGTVVPGTNLDAVVAAREVERAAVLARRRAGVPEAAGDRAPEPWTPPDPEVIGVTRRQFFNRSIVGLMGLSLSGFGTAIVAFLWPRPTEGFGGKIRAGRLTDILASIADSREPFYVPEGRFYINPYPEEALPAARAVYPDPLIPGMEAGVVALFQKCPHLGCRVPWCKTSQWFECPCHGSQYNRVGEKKAGPAPRGMDHFPISLDGDFVVVDTGARIDGPPIGTNTTGQEAEGPHCISSAEGGHG